MAEIVRTPKSSFPAFIVRDFPGEVHVETYCATAEGHCLITHRLKPSDAIKMARMLLAAAGVDGNKETSYGANVTHYTFID